MPELTADALRRFEGRLQTLTELSANPTDPTALRWTRQLRASQAKLEAQAVHQRMAQAVDKLRLQSEPQQPQTTLFQRKGLSQG